MNVHFKPTDERRAQDVEDFHLRKVVRFENLPGKTFILIGFGTQVDLDSEDTLTHVRYIDALGRHYESTASDLGIMQVSRQYWNIYTPAELAAAGFDRP